MTGTAPAPVATAERRARITHWVGQLIGSLARDSVNRKLETALVRLAPPELEMAEIPFKDLPLQGYDDDADVLRTARAFEDAIAAVEAVLFVMPECKRSVPGELRNAIDRASGPYGQNSFTRKPAAAIGASPGAVGTAAPGRTCAACSASATRRR